MPRTAFLVAAINIVLVIALSVFVAERFAYHIERGTEQHLVTILNDAEEGWATIRSDGFKVIVGGLAEDEAARFRTVQLISGAVHKNRILDKTSVSQPDGLSPPRFSLEILRNVDRASLIGLIPTSTGRDAILDRVRNLHPDMQITDMLELADYTAPDGWESSVEFGLEQLKEIARSKVSITPNRIHVTAVSDTPEGQETLKQSLARGKPETLNLVLDISAPRPVITPFIFRLKVSGKQGTLETCSADTNHSRSRIIRALARVNLTKDISCDVGLGVPTTDWSTAVIQSIDALVELGSATVTFKDSDISLIVDHTVSQKQFDRTIGLLENTLPDLFSLKATLTPKPLAEGEAGGEVLPDFSATKSPEGIVELRGRLPDQLRKDAVTAYAASLFDKENIYNQTRIVEGLPDNWTLRSMAGLEALSHLHNGSLSVLPDAITIKGKSSQKDISSTVSRIFTTRIGTDGTYNIDVVFDENLVKTKEDSTVLSDEACETFVINILATRKIDFAPSSSTIETQSQSVIDEIANALVQCPDARFEISGHTDSQGSEESNMVLSQGRADAVLTALLDRRILTSKMISKGYGETRPIANNETEEGRAQNRRIEFRLIKETAKDG